MEAGLGGIRAMGQAQATSAQVVPALSQIDNRLIGTIEAICKSIEVTRIIADRHFGAEPQDPSKTGPVPVPAGMVSQMSDHLDQIDRALIALAAQIGRLENL